MVTCSAHYAISQDVIFFHDSDSIVAKVLTVGTTEISYQKWSNLEGPVYYISTSKIATIRYANGSYDSFKNIPAASSSPRNTVNAIPSLSRSGNTYFYKDPIKNKFEIMNKREMLYWLEEQNCPIAYEQFKKGYRGAKGGWMLLSLGVGLDIIGGILIGIGRNNSKNTGPLAVGIALTCIGGAFEIISIPVLCVSYSKMHSAVNLYNGSCNKTAAIKPYWSLQTGTSGLGIAYHF